MSLTLLGLVTTLLIGSTVVLNSSALMLRDLNLSKKKNAMSLLVLSVLALTLIYRVYQVQAEPDPLDAGTFLLGEWEVYNNDEPDLYADWIFRRGNGNGILVSGNVYRAREPRRLGVDHEEMVQVGNFGPYDVQLLDVPGHLRFDYDEAEFGKGTAQMEVTVGMVGTYRDNAAFTQATEVDTGRVAVYRSRYDSEGAHSRRRIRSAFTTMLLALIASGLALVVFSRLRHLNRSESSRPWLPVASSILVLFILYLCGAHLLAVSTDMVRLTADTLSGPWTMDYIVDRSRVNRICIGRYDADKISITGELFFRKGLGPNPNGSESRASRGSIDSSPATFDVLSQQLEWLYRSSRGSGKLSLQSRPTMLGHFVDDRGTVPMAFENVGGLVAIKKMMDQGNE